MRRGSGPSGATSVTSTEDLKALKAELVAYGHSTAAKKAVPEIRGIKGNFAIALDATGSMESLIVDARRSIEEILNRLFKEASTHVKLQLLVYRDYDVFEDVLETSALTEDSQKLVRWLSNVRTFGGGANPGEAINEALQKIYETDAFDAAIVAGDEPSLPREQLDQIGKRQLKTAIEWAEVFGRRGVPIHTFVVGNRSDTARDFKLIAEKSGGQTGRLDGSKEMIDMAVMAMLSRLKGAASVRSYMKDHHLTENAKKFGALLLPAPTRSST